MGADRGGRHVLGGGRELPEAGPVPAARFGGGGHESGRSLSFVRLCEGRSSALTPLSALSPRREAQPEELQRFAARVAAQLQGPEPGPEAAACLQRLHLVVAASKYPRRSVRASAALWRPNVTVWDKAGGWCFKKHPLWS